MKISRKILILTLLLLTTAWAQYPAEWTVDVHAFENTMTLTGELIINDLLISEVTSAVAVFHHDECRGVVEGTPVGSEILYFLMIYGNTPGDSLEFRAWDASIGNVVLLEEEIVFSSGAALGEVDAPYQLSGTNSFSYIQAFDDSFEQAEDTEYSIPFDILGNDVYDRSLAMVVTFPTEPQHGMLFENLDQTFSYVSDLNFFGQDSFQYRVSHEYGADSAWAQVNVTPVDDPLTEFQLLNPADNTLFDENSGTTQNFSWEMPIDYDGDPITYSLYVFNDGVLDSSYSSSVNALDINIEALDRDTWLDWHVIAYDGWGWTVSADTFSMQISSLVDITQPSHRPEIFSVSQNFPNPFNPVTRIEYGLAQVSDVKITIHDLSGRLVQNNRLEGQHPGWYTFKWDGSGMSGEVVPAGIYLCRVQSGYEFEVVKMLFLK